MDLGAYIAYSQPLFDWAEYDRKLLQNELLRTRIARARGQTGGPSLGNQRFVLNLMNSIKSPDKLHPVAEREWNEAYNRFLDAAAAAMMTGDISGVMQEYGRTMEAARRVKYNSQQYQKLSDDIEKGLVPITKEEHEVWLRGEGDLPFSAFRSSEDKGASGIETKIYSPTFKVVESPEVYLGKRTEQYFKTHGLGNIKNIRPGLLFMTTKVPREVLKGFIEEYSSDLNKMRSHAYEFYRQGKYSKALEEDKDIEEEAKARAENVIKTLKAMNRGMMAVFGRPILPDMPVTKTLINAEKEALINKYKEEMKGEGAERATSYLMIPEINRAVIDNDESRINQIPDKKARIFLKEYSRYLKNIIDSFDPSMVRTFRYSIGDGSQYSGFNVDVSVRNSAHDNVGITSITGTIGHRGKSVDNYITALSRNYILSDISGGGLTENINKVISAGSNIMVLTRPPVEAKIKDIDISIIPVARRSIPEAGIKEGQILTIDQIMYGKESGILQDGDVLAKAYIQGVTMDNKNIIYMSYRDVKPKLRAVYGSNLVDKIIQKGVENFKQLYGLKSVDLYDDFESVVIPEKRQKVESIRNIINKSKGGK